MEQTTEQAKQPGTITVPDQLNEIAGLIKRQWTSMYFGAVPYVQAMQYLKTIDDNYGDDTGRSIVTYFLGNAKTWKGEYAKAVKAKLNALLKEAA